MNCTYPTRRIISSLFFLLVCISSSFSQTLIDFNDDDKWIRSQSGTSIIGYATDHAYEDGLFRATGGEACRITSSDQDGVPGALGNYAWKLKNVTAVDWRITIASGGVGNFSLKIRRWDDDPGPHYQLTYSANGGTTWEELAQVTNETLDNLSDWKIFSGNVNSSNDNILIRLTPTKGTERIMVDDFEWTSYVANSNTSPDDHNLQLWPIPASETLYGRCDERLRFVELINMTGTKVREIKLSGDNEFSISVNDLNEGIYFIRMTYLTGRETCTRIVILH
ncbi:T9SS type A sorting domain-containing protein [Marinilabilia salmonicolor]|uniref:T9SS type A sorting domain-containing protein n=1 Tax=Marinilabilia salmonicolor TaxID=989 RepID=UPI00029B0665|nr:T9SS type A sorting domain-containing protein [Marinilabilia salmonicolor]